jgi:hypothetical protein
MGGKNTMFKKIYLEWFTREGWSFLFDVWKIKFWHILCGFAAAESMGIGAMMILAYYLPLPAVGLIVAGIAAIVIGLLCLIAYAWAFTKINWQGNYNEGKMSPLVSGSTKRNGE